MVEPIASSPVPCPMQTGIVFDRVSFHYPGSHRPVLHEITLTIRRGKLVALVGANGSGKTTLISHRLSTVRMADRIYVMEAGTIVEGGTHEELMDHHGTYARLFATQAQYYR
jgi:ABC-type multidrug transport system fused ATPase/permease subunit